MPHASSSHDGREPLSEEAGASGTAHVQISRAIDLQLTRFNHVDTEVHEDAC